MQPHKNIYQYLLLKVSVLLLGGATVVNAATLDISELPLSLGAQSPPAVFFTLDDSGSMDVDITSVPYWTAFAYDHRYQVTNKTIDSTNTERYVWNSATNESTTVGHRDVSGYWMAYNPGANDNNRSDTVEGRSLYHYINAISDDVDAFSGSSSCDEWSHFRDHIYDPNGTGNPDVRVSTASANQCTAADPDLPYRYDWRGRSFDFNMTYYNSGLEYLPWKGDCHASSPAACGDQSFTSARNNPHHVDAGYSSSSNLTGFVYEIWEDDKGFSGTRPQRGTAINMSTGANGLVDLWDTHYRITVNASDVTVQQYTGSASEPATAATGIATSLSGTACFNILGDSAAITTALTGSINSVGAAGCKTLATAKQDIANWWTYYRKRSFVTKYAIGAVMESKPGNRYGLTVLNEYSTLFEEINPDSTGDFTTHNDAVIQNLYGFNWLARGTPLRAALQRTGQYFDDTLSVGGTDLDDPITSECQSNHNILFTDGYYNGSVDWEGTNGGDDDGDGTADRLADIAKYYYDTDLSGRTDSVIPTAVDPATHQHMVTHGISFGVFSALEDTDGDGRPNPGGVLNRWLNESGQEVESDGTATGETVVNATTGGWGDATSNALKINDLWHAAYNSKGLFSSAKNPEELRQAIEDSVGHASSQSGTMAAPAQSSSRVRDGSAIYIGSFDSNNWTGNLEAFLVSDGSGNQDSNGNNNSLCIDTTVSPNVPFPAGQLCARSWAAASQVTAQSTRRIISTRDDTGAGVVFGLANLSAAQQSNLNNDADVVSWLRGDNTNEGFSAGDLRDRGTGSARNILGDIIGSSPIRVAQPAFFYTFDNYSTFRTDFKDRTPLVYVGANDGMLHAFNASTGDEVFAYVPETVYSRLEGLSDQNYSHKYTVNGSPNYGDVFYNSKWRSVLVGSAAQGGQGVYALDITNPDDSTQTTDYPRLDQAETGTNPDRIALWEFTDTDDAGTTTVIEGDIDLGNVIGKPKIVKLNTGVWAAVFGNGFNNTAADGSVSTTGQAAIYVVNAVTGALIKKFSTGKGMTADPDGNSRPNGIGELALIDMDGDSDADYIYAGDLFGNFWKINITSSMDTNWGFSHLSGSTPVPFFIATSGSTVRPITSEPVLIRHPVNYTEALIVFGTGKMFEVGDNLTAGADDQAVFGIREKFDDANYGPVAYNSLVQQTITKQVVDDVTGELFREVSNNSVDYSPSNDNGWRLDLKFGTDNMGERIAAKPQIIGELLVLTSNLPSTNPCEPNGTSYLYGLNVATGGRLDRRVFDLDNDGVVNSSDTVNYTDSGTAETLIPSAVGFGSLLSGGTVMYGEDLAQIYLGSQVGDGDDNQPDCGPAIGIECVGAEVDPGLLGRQSWRQIK